MSEVQRDHELIVQKFGPDTPVWVVRGDQVQPSWSNTARLGSLTEALVPQGESGYENSEARFGLVIALPIGMNMPGRLIAIVPLEDRSASFVTLARAEYERMRRDLPAGSSDAADEARHRELIFQKIYGSVD